MNSKFEGKNLCLKKSCVPTFQKATPKEGWFSERITFNFKKIICMGESLAPGWAPGVAISSSRLSGRYLRSTDTHIQCLPYDSLFFTACKSKADPGTTSCPSQGGLPVCYALYHNSFFPHHFFFQKSSLECERLRTFGKRINAIISLTNP